MKQIFTFLFFFLALNFINGQITVKDGDINAGDTYNMTNNNTYLLDGLVFVESGATLNIEAGTIIKGIEVPTTGDNASALIISRDAQINAVGTSDNPIIFTAEIDDTNDPIDMLASDRGLWGGLIILGNGRIADDGCVQSIEGIPPGDDRALYGNTDCSDEFDGESSGTLQFVSIRHGGAEIGSGNEINGLTLGGVGSGTTLDHIEVFSNLDDGIEFFGGTAQVTRAAVSFCGDDAMDYDHAWQGKGQFWFVLVDGDGDNGGEHDGATPDDNPVGFSNPIIYNATYIGGGANGSNNALFFRDNAAGNYTNSIFTLFDNGILVEDVPGTTTDSYNQLQTGNLSLKNNLWWDFQGDLVTESPADVLDILVASGNTVENPDLGGVSYTDDGNLNPTPDASGPAYEASALAEVPANDDFFVPTKFKGAFCDEGVWIGGWTALSEYGILDSSLGYTGTTCDLSSVEDIFQNSKGYVLVQNNPNPVIGTTNIQFELPISTEISLYVYDTNGKIVARIYENEKMFEGKHNVEFDASDLASGTYFYSLQNKDVILSHRMIVK